MASETTAARGEGKSLRAVTTPRNWRDSDDVAEVGVGVMRRLSPGTVLDALNFSLAGAREGFGPFLGVYLQSRGFDPATTGALMSVAGAAGLSATTPAGILIDRTLRKRAALAAALAAIAAGAVVIVITGRPWIIALGQALIGVGDTSVAPLIAAITLGLSGPILFGRRMARNDGFNHAGNAILSAVAALLGWQFGLGYVAIPIVIMAALSVMVAWMLDPATINHAMARSGESDGRSALAVLAGTPRTIVLTSTVLLFQTADGAITPFLAQARVESGANASLVTGAMIVIARVAMVGAALWAPRLAARRGFPAAMTLALATVVVRAVLAAFATTWWLVIIVQMLDGLALGLAGVAMPALNAGNMDGSSRTTAGFAALMTAFGLGATLSPLVAGFAAGWLGYPASFGVLAAVGTAGLMFWIIASRFISRREAMRVST